jgi:hypothetical protein
MSFLVAGEAWIHISNYWFFSWPNIKHCRISNWNKEVFLFNQHIDKFKKMLFTNGQFGEVDICEQELA